MADPGVPGEGGPWYATPSPAGRVQIGAAQAWAGIGFLGLGVPAYYLWKRTSTQERHER